ncbi:MAG TPA: NeuD/PglB/VioB family sugar acetyltransferase [Verrucomicrobiae bacterium]|nr:NeuD/PglB/VioB family sugar acetyltransferase [Verrucomicrobiae bacterium]
MSPQKLIIISAGKFGREVCTWAGQAIQAGAPWTIKGFLDDRPDILRRFHYEPPILAPVEEYSPADADLFICAVAEPSLKKHYCSMVEQKGGNFATLVHPTALVGHEVLIGCGCILGPFTQLSCDLTLGKHVAFGTHSNTAHDTRIGDYCQISGSCEINGNATLEEGVFLGSHATILPNAHVSAWAYVGAGSVVLKRVGAGLKVFGNPAVPIGELGGQRATLH